VLHVVEPHLNGPGGDLVGVFATADAGVPTVLMGQGPAPAAATIAHYRSEGLDLVPDEDERLAMLRRRVALARAAAVHIPDARQLMRET